MSLESYEGEFPPCLFLDIETYGGADVETPEFVHLINKHIEEKAGPRTDPQKKIAEFWDTAALKTMTSHIAAIGMAINDREPLVCIAPSEIQVIEMFNERIAEFGHYTPITWNGSSYDIPILRNRFAAYDIMPAAVIPWSESKYSAWDLRGILTGYENMAPGTLSQWACSFGYPIKEGLLSVLKIKERYLEGDYPPIVEKCAEDIRMTRFLFERVRGNRLRGIK